MKTNNQLRKHLERTLKVKWRAFRARKQLGDVGNEVYIDKNVEFLRYPKNIKLGSSCVIKEGARICPCNEGSGISIGERTTIGYHTFLFASAGISIGDDCLIAPFVYIVDSDHGIEKGLNINRQPNSSASIIIGNDVWIGTGVKILKGVSIADGAIIAAGAILKDNVLENEIWGGTPAKKISERK